MAKLGYRLEGTAQLPKVGSIFGSEFPRTKAKKKIKLSLHVHGVCKIKHMFKRGTLFLTFREKFLSLVFIMGTLCFCGGKKNPVTNIVGSFVVVVVVVFFF